MRAKSGERARSAKRVPSRAPRSFKKGESPGNEVGFLSVVLIGQLRYQGNIILV